VFSAKTTSVTSFRSRAKFKVINIGTPILTAISDRAIRFATNAFPLEQLEEALCNGVIVTVTHSQISQPGSMLLWPMRVGSATISQTNCQLGRLLSGDELDTSEVGFGSGEDCHEAQHPGQKRTVKKSRKR
jgi:hypothetical protein